MAPKLTPKKLENTQRRPSKMRPGKASSRESTALIVIYGKGKTGKTHSLKGIAKRAKWVITDPNAIPTLKSVNALPHPDDTYEVSSVEETITLLNEMLDAAESEQGGLGVDFVIMDGITHLAGFHLQDVARATGQRFMGENQKDNGWQRFGAEFGNVIDLLVALSKHVTVIVVAHAGEKFDSKKGDMQGFSLPPKMADKLGQCANWILYYTVTSEILDSEDKSTPDAFSQIETRALGERVKITRAVHTSHYNRWIAVVNCRDRLDLVEAPDMATILEKAGLI